MNRGTFPPLFLWKSQYQMWLFTLIECASSHEQLCSPSFVKQTFCSSDLVNYFRLELLLFMVCFFVSCSFVCVTGKLARPDSAATATDASFLFSWKGITFCCDRTLHLWKGTDLLHLELPLSLV